MQKHIHNINPRINVVAADSYDDIGRRLVYAVNHLGDETRDQQPDGSVISRRPVDHTVPIDFTMTNEEALLAVVEDRLADRAAGEFGNRRVDMALKLVRKALTAVRADADKPMRKRPAAETAPAEAAKTDIQIPGVTPGEDPQAVN